jgi:hypothetical protein
MRNFQRFLVVLAILSVNCAKSNIKTEHAANVNFRVYKYYTWVEETEKQFDHLTNPIPNKKILDGYIRETVNMELEKQGYYRTRVKPDFWVNYHLGIRDKLYVEDWSRTSDYKGEQKIAMPYREGALVLEFLDGETRERTWRGFTTSTLSMDPEPDKSEGKIRAAVEKMLRRFPPKKSRF